MFTTEGTTTIYTAKRESTLYALVLVGDSTIPEPFKDSSVKNLKDLQERVRAHYGVATFMAPTDFQTEVERRQIHTPEMIAILQKHSELYKSDLPTYYVYGSGCRPMSRSSAHIEHAVYIQTDNQQETRYYTYVVVPERLAQDIIENYEITFVSGPITQYLGNQQD